MRIRGADHAEFVGVGSDLGFELQAELERITSVFVLQHFLLLGFAQIEIALVPALEIGELVIRREIGMGLTVSLDLRHLV
jgi:hypothetical protein